ncbi:hypothetical protein D3C80_2045720 [compost metagenome]
MLLFLLLGNWLWVLGCNYLKLLWFRLLIRLVLIHYFLLDEASEKLMLQIALGTAG